MYLNLARKYTSIREGGLTNFLVNMKPAFLKKSYLAHCEEILAGDYFIFTDTFTSSIAYVLINEY